MVRTIMEGLVEIGSLAIFGAMVALMAIAMAPVT
jgi:hypothetical protein